MNVRTGIWVAITWSALAGLLPWQRGAAGELRTDVLFAEAAGEKLTLDVFVPEGPGPFPTCILVHGGGFTRGDKQSFIKPLFEPLSQAGFVWLSINYRLAPQHRWPACLEDVETAIRWVKAHASDYKVDTRRLALIGESAGGHLVSMAGARATDATRVAAVVPFYAPHDLELQVHHRQMLGESMRALLGLEQLDDGAYTVLRRTSPSSYVRPQLPPYLLIHGDQDPTVPYEQSVRFARQMTAAGNRCDLLTIPQGGHGMGGWEKLVRSGLAPDYRQKLIAWLRQVMPADPRALRLPSSNSIRAQIDRESPAPLPPEEAARSMIVPDGFRVTLFAGEPHVQQPIGFCIDDRGRLWVAEAYNYPVHGDRPGDRIVILEDKDSDGAWDERTVFYDGLNYVTGIEVGFGGAWVMSPPNLYFIPDHNGDDQPDSRPQILLDGFGNHANAHNLANGFAWGPDGWLYGTHGRTNWSMVGRPGTPSAQRVRFDGGVYRYHPVRHIWEPVADGTTNPWGIDWDDYGQAFVCNCVNPHLFHVIPGAHYEPWRDRESSQYAYERIGTIADHLHFTGGGDVRAGLGSEAEDDAGGGHAHCGTMVYLGDNWPDSYRNTVFMNNIHGRRINQDVLRRVGSGYSASHGRDLMVSRDPWFMGVTLQYGPDGGVFASDWSDTGECHSIRNTRRETGRIYKITYGTPRPASFDLVGATNAELVAYHLHRNDWFVRHSRRILQERWAAGQDMSDVVDRLHRMLAEQADVTRQLRALWTLHAIDGLSDELLTGLLDQSDEHLRIWAIRLLCEDHGPPVRARQRMLELAQTDPAPAVRLELACSLQRLAGEPRWAIAAALAARAEDAGDANLPLMIWYGIEPLVDHDAERFVGMTGTARMPLVRRHGARRASSSTRRQQALEQLSRLLAGTDDTEQRQDLLQGILQGLSGSRSVPMPASWPEAYGALRGQGNMQIQEQSLELALIFDDPVALRSLRELAVDRHAEPPRRIRAIQALVAKHVPELASLLLQLLPVPEVRGAALRGLAEFDDPRIIDAILDQYATFGASDRQDALMTLASRPAWAAALLSAIESARVPRTDLTTYTVRQIRSLGDSALAEKLVALWGEVRDTPADKSRLIANYKRRLTTDVLDRADLGNGRAVFHKTCANCHRLFDAGGNIGPELTGAQRRNLDYVLENMIDPSAAVAKDFQMQVIVTATGRVVTGLVVDEAPQSVTVQTINERVVIPVDEIEMREIAGVSMMPEGLLQSLDTDQVRDLVAYLASARQVPLPELTDQPSSP